MEAKEKWSKETIGDRYVYAMIRTFRAMEVRDGDTGQLLSRGTTHE